MTTADEFDTAAGALHERIAARKIIQTYQQQCGPRAMWALRRPDGIVRHCGHAGGRQTLDWICPDRLHVYCDPCAVEHFTDIDTGWRHMDPRMLRCIVCGSTDSLGPITAPIQLSEELDAEGGVILSGRIETAPLFWECPAHDGFGGGEIRIEIEKWSA